jgi:glycosidase
MKQHSAPGICSYMAFRGIILGIMLFGGTAARPEAMLQLFNLTWNEVANKIPEIAEAGYTSLWLPPPTKGNGGFSVGYDLFDPFDLGDRNQRGIIRTKYGTKAELQRMVAIAHRFGLRVYFDNIMNHRAGDVPGYNSSVPTNLYPGTVPGDFHLRVLSDGSYRNASNIRDYNSVWQVQNLSLLGLVDIAHENPNANFGATEGSTAPKPILVRHPNNPEFYDEHPTLGRVGFGRITQADLNANPSFYREDVNAYLLRSIRWLFDQTKCDGLRLDAVKHVPSYFFGAQTGADRDTSSAGYIGNAQLQYNLTHGFTDSNHRNSNFDTETPRNDALIFGEHLGEPPGFGEYIDAGMRLLDNPLRNHLNNVLGNPGASLSGLDQRDAGGFSAAVRVMHAQSHDNDFAARRELHNAYYFFREGVPLIYSDGYNEAPSDGGTPFPRHANAPYLGQFGDSKMPDLAWLHHQLARGGTRPRWSDSDVVGFERYDYREPANAADQTVMLFAMNDNYGNPGDISFDDGVAQNDGGIPSTCYPVVNSRNQGLVVGFPPGTRLWQMADSPGDSRACRELLVRLATNNRSEATASANDSDPVNRKVYVGGQTLAPGGGAIEFKIPSGSYVAYALPWPQASRVDTTLTNAAGAVAATDGIVLLQGGRVAPRVLLQRIDGKDGDSGFNPLYPFKMRGSVDLNGNVLRGNNVTSFTYAISVPVVTNSPFDVLVRVDGSAGNVLAKLDGGIDINSHMNLGPSSTTTAGLLDLRDNKPGLANDMFLGYEATAFQFRYGPEKFAARTVSRNAVRSPTAETYIYTVGSNATTNRINGDGYGNDYSTETPEWVYHDPAAFNGISGGARSVVLPFTNVWRYDQSGTNHGVAWRDPAFNDSAWAVGRGVFALETIVLPAPTNTILRLTNAAGNRVTNYYFRTQFTPPTNLENLVIVASNLIDDGAVFYLNGSELFRYNMPTGAVSATTFATNTVEADSFVTFNIAGELLQPGDNVLAVEVHQATADSSDVVFGCSLNAIARQRSTTMAESPIDIWVKVGCEGEANVGHVYYSSDGSAPEGAFGVGHGTTGVVPLVLMGPDGDDNSIEWWRGTIPAHPAGTEIRYKVALFNNAAAPIESYKDTARYGLAQFAITNWHPASAQVWLHNNLNTNDVITGLPEGFHILRARAFIPRTGKSSVFNTFLQTFYHDSGLPEGAIAFPSNGETLRSTEYGVVVRADHTVTEVEYNIIDSNPNNDDAATGFNNGNGLINGSPVFGRAALVTPLASLSQQYPNYPQEFRFNYEAVPSSGSATITIRLKELTTSINPAQIRTLTRAVNTLAPPQTLTFLAPAANGQNITVSNNAAYTLVVCFSDTLTADPDLFTVRIDGVVQPRTNELGEALYRIQGTSCGSGRRDFRYDWSGMSSGQHYLEAFYNGDGLSLQATRLVRVTVIGVVDTDGDGLPDRWEDQHHFDANDSTGENGPEGDPDQDGFLNIQEYLAGTDPRDPDSLLEIVAQANGGRRLTWKSVPGKNYRVYATAEVTEAFEPIGGTLSTNITTSFTDPTPAATHKFYRVEVLR